MNNPQRIGTLTGRLGNKRTSGDHPNYSIIKIVQNTKKSPGYLGRLAVTQTPVKKPSANVGVKYSQKSKIIITKSQENIYHLMYSDDIKIFAKNEKGLETLQ